MENKEKLIAAVLFILTALFLPVVLRLGGQGKKESESVEFLVQSAAFELRLETALKARLKGEALPPEMRKLFHVDEWVEAAANLDEGDRQLLAAQIGAVCVALDRPDDAAMLLSRLGVKLESSTPFSYLFNEGILPEEDTLRRDIEASSLPGWVQNLLIERYGEGKKTFAPLEGGMLDRAVSSYLSDVGLLAGILMVMFLAGMVVLALAPRLASQLSKPVSVLEEGGCVAGPVQSWLLVIGWFGISTVGGMLLVPLLSDRLSKAGLLLVSYGLAVVVGVLLVKYRGAMRSRSLAAAVNLDAAAASFKAVGLGVLGYLGAIPVVFFLLIASAILLGGGSEGVNPGIPILLGAPTSTDRWVVLFTVVVMAPVFEEFLFRGFLFKQLRRFFGGLNGAALSGLIFASVHLSIESFLPLFGLGMVLAGVYHYARSLWASIVTHALWNLGTAVSILVLYGQVGG